MSNVFIKNLPWIVPAVAILAVGSGFLDRINSSFDGNDAPVAQAPMAAPAVDPAVAAVAAVAPIATPAQVAVAQAPAPAAVAPEQRANVADQLAVLLTETPPMVPATTAQTGDDIEVTRSAGFSFDTLEQARDGALSVQPAPQAVAASPAPVATTGPVGADFFASAQQNLARDRQCIDELRTLASQARVYFPSGGLTGEQEGIGQARILGLLAQQCPGVIIQVEGHSDASGNPTTNERLSFERAQSVITRVAASGIDADLFTAVGRGSASPSLVRGPEAASYYDRRVEFSIVESETSASFAAPTFGSTTSPFQTAACVSQLTAAVQGAHIEYAPRGMTVSDVDLALASQLAGIAANCPQARLRLVGQYSEDPRAGEDTSTGRLRAVVLMNNLVAAGFPADQLILGAPSDARPIAGLSDSRVDFDIILEDR